MENQMETSVIAGTRPVGSTPADGTHIWATRSFTDGQYRFTTYNGWLIVDETTTTDSDLAVIIGDILKHRIGTDPFDLRPAHRQGRK